MIYLPILIFFVFIPLILLGIALEDLGWYSNWSRKRQWKHMKKHYDNNK